MHKTRRPLTLTRLAALVATVAVVAAGAVWVALAAETPDGDVLADPPPAVQPAIAGELTGTEPEEEQMRITDIAVPGPAADIAVTETLQAPNRVGSALVPVRLYEPTSEPWATLVWAHGGSFVRGTLDWPEADWVSRSFAEAGVRVYSVDYVLASDTVKAPAPSADLAAVLRWVRAEASGPVVVGGASAGAHLAVLAAVDAAEIAGGGSEGIAPAPLAALLLEYPTLHREQPASEAISALTAGLPERKRFGAARVAEMYEFYLGEAGAGASGAGAVVAGELPGARLAVLPPTVIVNADADDLRASAEVFAEQLREAGVPVVEAVEPGTVHGYLNSPEASPEALVSAQHTIDLFVSELRRIIDAEVSAVS